MASNVMSKEVEETIRILLSYAIEGSFAAEEGRTLLAAYDAEHAKVVQLRKELAKQASCCEDEAVQCPLCLSIHSTLKETE